MNNVFDLLFMLVNLQQMVNNNNQLGNQQNFLATNHDPYAGLESMPNVQIIRGTPKPRTSISPDLNSISTSTTTTTNPPLDFSKTFLQEVKMNKCCPLNYHYSEDKFGRMKCKKTSSEIGRVVSKSKIFKTVQQYSCEASMGQYIDDFSHLDLNGDGFVKYKSEIYEKFCMDYDAKKGKFIIIKCKSAKKDDGPRDSRVLEILKKRAEKQNEIVAPANANAAAVVAPIRKPQLKVKQTRPTTTTTSKSVVISSTTSKQIITTNSDEYSYEEVDESEEIIPEVKSRGHIKSASVEVNKNENNKKDKKSDSDEYEIEYEYDDIE